MSSKKRYCAVCSAEIEAERLENSETRLCVRHAKEIEKYGGEFKSEGVYGSLGKKEGIKKHYGDVSVTRWRNDEALERLRDDYDNEKWTKKAT